MVLYLLVSGALASTSLVTDTLAVGVNPDGSLVTSDGSLGLLADPDGVGPVPIGGDLLVDGAELELWTVHWSGGSVRQGAPELGGSQPLEWHSWGDNGALVWADGTGVFSDLTVETWVDARYGHSVLWMNLRLEATTDLHDVWVARIAEPAIDEWATGQDASWQEASGSVAVSEGEWDGRAVALAADGGVAGLCGGCTTPDEVVAGQPGPVFDDLRMGVAVSLGDLAAGEVAEVQFAYAVAMGADNAVKLAEEAAADLDHDQDGYDRDVDCDDRDPLRAPDGFEWADGLDNDCDDIVDEDTAISDDDGDGFAEVDGDCDDDRADVYPGAGPVDGVADADCDGVDDDGSWPGEPDDGQVTTGEDGGSEAAPTLANGGGSCSTAGGPAWLALIAGLAALRRRREDEP